MNKVRLCDYERLWSLMSSAKCFIASLILSLPNWVELSVVPGPVENKLHTVDDECYLVVHVPHSVVDPMSGP